MANKLCPRCRIIKDETEFWKGNYGKSLATYCKSCQNEYNNNYQKERRKDPNNTFEQEWAKGTRHSHKKRGFIVNITNQELTEMAKNTHECPICGVQFKKYNIGKPDYNSPTLDRIDNSNELNKDNVMIICMRCNASKQDRSIKEFIEYCKIVIDKLK